MSKLRCHISISLDGFVAGPNQSEEHPLAQGRRRLPARGGSVAGRNQRGEIPLGEGGEGLHDWVVPLAAWRESHGKQGGEVNESARIVEESRANIGAGVMGRKMFVPIGGGAWGAEQGTRLGGYVP